MSRRRGRAYDEQVVHDAIEADGNGDDVAVVGGNSHEMVEVGGLEITHLLVHSGGVGLSLDGGAAADDDVAVPADRDSLADGNGLLTGAGSDGEAEGPEGLVDPGLSGGRRGTRNTLLVFKVQMILMMRVQQTTTKVIASQVLTMHFLAMFSIDRRRNEQCNEEL